MTYSKAIKKFAEKKEYLWYGRHIPRCLLWIGDYIKKKNKLEDFRVTTVREVTDNLYLFMLINPAKVETKYAVVNVKCEPLTIEHWIFETPKEAEDFIREKFGVHAGVDIPPESEIYTEEDVETEEEKIEFLKKVFPSLTEKKILELYKKYKK